MQKISLMGLSPNEKLENAIKEIGGGYTSVSKETGIVKRTLERATEIGATIKSEYLIKLYDTYGIRPGSILEPTYDNYVVEGEENDKSFVSINYYPNVKASAGHGLVPENEEPLPIKFRSIFVSQKLKASPKDLIAIKANGDSMYPDIKDGDLLIIDTSRNKVQSENPYLVVLDEQVLVKNVQVTGVDSFELISENKDYPPQSITGNGNFFRILGEVRHIQRTLN